MAYKMSFQFLRRVCMASNSLIPKYPEYVRCLAVKQPERGLCKNANFITSVASFRDSFNARSNASPMIIQIRKVSRSVPKNCENKSDESVGTETNPMFSHAVLYGHPRGHRSKEFFLFPGGSYSELLNFKKEKFQAGEDEDCDPYVAMYSFTYAYPDGVKWKCTNSFLEKFSDLKFNINCDLSHEEIQPDDDDHVVLKPKVNLSKLHELKGDIESAPAGTETNPMFDPTVLYDKRSKEFFLFPGGSFSELVNFKKEKFQKGEDEDEFDPFVALYSYLYTSKHGVKCTYTWNSFGEQFSDLKKGIKQ